MKTKKEIKEEYKQIKIKKGVFVIKNNHNNKIFISSSVNLNSVWNSQKFKLSSGIHPNKQLQKEWTEFGGDNFAFEVISEIKDTEDPTRNYEEEIKELEGLYIEEVQPFDDKGYNKK